MNHPVCRTRTLELCDLKFEGIDNALEFISSALSLECLHIYGNLGPINGLGSEKCGVALLNQFPVLPFKQIAFGTYVFLPPLFHWVSVGQPFTSVNTVTLCVKYIQVIKLISGYLRVLGPVLKHLLLDFGLHNRLLGMPVNV